MMNFTKTFVKIMKEDGKKERQAGRKEGRKFGEQNIIRSLFNSQMSAKEIAERTGIALSEILRIVK